MQVFTASFFILALRWTEPKCPLTDKWTNQMLYVHTKEFYSALKKSGVLTPATTQMNLEKVISGKKKKKPSTRGHLLSDSIYRNCPSRICKSSEAADWRLLRAGQWGRGGSVPWPFHGYEASFQGEETFLRWRWWWLYRSVNILKATALHALNR